MERDNAGGRAVRPGHWAIRRADGSPDHPDPWADGGRLLNKTSPARNHRAYIIDSGVGAPAPLTLGGIGGCRMVTTDQGQIVGIFRTVRAGLRYPSPPDGGRPDKQWVTARREREGGLP
ncbi:hypothetical protein GCM10018954_025930 [Kutzneria kofuensis]